MRFKTKSTTSGNFFIKEARSLDNDGKSLYTEYLKAKDAAKLLHPIYGTITPPPIKYSDAAIHFKNLSNYETAVPSLFYEDNRIRENAAELVERIGAILAFIHDRKSDCQSQTEFPSSFPLSIDNYLNLKPALLNLLENLSSQTHSAINNLRSIISSPNITQCYIHGDFKPDNILLHGQKIQIIDWELAGQGVPEHDFASFYAGLFTELVHRSMFNPTHEKKDMARIHLTNATKYSILCTRWLISSYQKIGNPIPNIPLATRLIGAKLLARTAMHYYINTGASPFASILQQAAEHCLNRPAPLSYLLSKPVNEMTIDASL